MKSRKSQFTVFVILGFVLLIIMLFVFFMIVSLTTSSLDEQARRAVREYTETQAINYFVQSCIDSAVKESVDTLALQGGRFFTTQGGPYELEGVGETHIPFRLRFVATIDGEATELILPDFDVTYGLVNESPCDLVVMEPPDYPYPNMRLENLAARYDCQGVVQEHSGFFGLNKYPSLCYFYENNPNIPDIDNVVGPCSDNTRIFRMRNDSLDYTLTYQLENFLSDCLVFDAFQTHQGHTVRPIDEAEPNVSILYDLQTFTVHLEYPFLVEIQGRQPIVTSYSFEYKSDLRLTLIQRYLLNLLREEAQNIHFDISSQYSNIQGYDPDFEVRIFDFFNDGIYHGFDDFEWDEDLDVDDDVDEVVSHPSYRYDRLVILQDRSSMLGGRPLTVLTAIKNRRPALDYIRQTTHPHFHIIVMENQTINIDPIGIDPDRRPVEYYYGGWKQDYDEAFNFNDPACTGPLNNVDSLLNCMVRIPSVQPMKWNTSEEFIRTSRAANYTTNRTDLGYHKINVTVVDVSGLIDYQTVNILVIDLPTANVSVPSVYVEVPEGVISVEDPFVMDGSESLPPFIGGGNLTYEWKVYMISDSGEVLVFQNITEESSITIPFNITDPSQILGMHNETVRQHGDMSPGKYRLELGVRAGTGNEFVEYMDDPESLLAASASVYVNATECIPYRSNAAAYPYNSLPNPFYANHSCCLGNINNPSTYALAPVSQVCYQEDMFGELQSLRAHIETISRDAMLEGYEFIGEREVTIFPQNPNSVYTLKFERMCDGRRGNICGGDSEVVISTTSALECNYNPNLAEQCSGPAHNLSSATIICTNYGQGNSFERNFGLNNSFGQPATGTCNTAFECSTATTYNDPSGPYLAQSTCDGQGGCTRPINAECSISQCGAQCDADSPSFRWEVGGVCRYGGCSGCRYQSQTIVHCSPNNPNCIENPSGIPGGETCYYGATCDQSGGGFNNAGTRNNLQAYIDSNPSIGLGCTSAADWGCGPDGWHCNSHTYSES